MPADGIVAVRSTSLPIFKPGGKGPRGHQKCQFVCDLALEGLNLGSDELAAVLSRYAGMTALHLGLNGLTENGLRAVGMLVGIQRDLEYLDVWGNPGMGSFGAFSILAPLTSSRCKLRTLNLSQCGLGGSVLAGVLSLASRGHLRALSLANNSLGPESGRELAEVVKCGILALDFSDCGLGPRGVAPLAKLLKNGGPCSCILLGLSWNGLGEAGLASLLASSVQYVSRSQSSLKELCLRGNGRISLLAAQHARRLAETEKFWRLNLSRNTASPEADLRLREPITLDKMILPERVTTEADMGLAADEDDTVYWHRLAALDATDPRRPSLDGLPPQTMPARVRSQPTLLDSELPSAWTRVSSHASPNRAPVTLAVASSIPLRNRRNEAEAFEAFIVMHSRFASPRCPGPDQWFRVGERSPAQKRGKLRRGLVGIKRPTTR